MQRHLFPALFLLAALITAGGAAAAAAVPPPAEPRPECRSPLPQVVDVGLPYSEGVALAPLEASLRKVVGAKYAGFALCPERPLQVNVALGSDYQILDWLERGAVDVAVVPVLGLHLLRNDGLDLVEVTASPADLRPLVGREPVLTLRWRGAGGGGSRSGHQGDLARLAADLWRNVGGEASSPGPSLQDLPVGRLVLPSHLSTAGFVVPVLAMEDALDRLADGGGDPVARRRRFWEAFYDRVCFRFGADLGRRDDGACAPPAGTALLEIAAVPQSGDGSGAPLEGPPTLGPRTAYRDRLVIRRATAEAVFAADAFPPAEANDWDELHLLEELFARRSGGPAENGEALPTAFDSFLTADDYFGTRTFAFRVGESLDLIELHQEISGDARLALVLPGGGVKAAYQSRVLDHLYGNGRLRNAGVVEASDAGTPPLLVESVVGTSGGALLGFFVARLGAAGPWNLSDILWRPGGSGDYLTFSQVFGWTDLLRYVSLVVILLALVLVLGVLSLRRGGFLAPERQPREAEADEPPAPRVGSGDEDAPRYAVSVRPALLVLIAGILGLTPLAVRWVTREVSMEHVPEFEGLLYAVLVGIAIFADQCLVRVERKVDPPAPERMWLPPAALVAVGAALAGLPILLRLGAGPAAWLEGEVRAGTAYLVLGPVGAALSMVAVRRRRGGWHLAAEGALWILAFVWGTAVAVVLLRLSSEWLLGVLDRTPLLFLALFAALLLTAAVRYAGGGGDPPRVKVLAKGYAAVESGFDRLRRSAAARWGAAVLVPALACLIVLDLTRPEAQVFLARPLADLLAEASKLHAPRGALAVCLGAVLLAAGGVAMLHQRRNHYRLEGVDRFGDSFVLVVVGLAFAVYVVLAVTVFVVAGLGADGAFAGSALLARIGELTLFELTPAFWIGLGVVSLLVSSALGAWAYAGRRRGGRIASFLDRSLCHLCSRHPNAHLVSRRFLRVFAMSVGALVWWNLILAPALYGNRYAVDYLERTDLRFERSFCREHLGEARCPEGEPTVTSYGLTARFLTPANALETDGTRFVLAVPGGEGCPAVPASPGVTWRRFRTVIDAAEAEESDDGCELLALGDADQRQVLKSYVFASGSPFPAFPARRVRVPREDRFESLVDGGYSNNVPLEAAQKIGAAQALVVHSSHPRPEPSEGGLFAALAGPLVDNLPRLLGFLYQRSQQLDRRSGSNLFVVSLAPPSVPDWPLLTDFRSATVARMLRAAEEDLGRRIGLVESWGPPGFQASFRVPGRVTSR